MHLKVPTLHDYNTVLDVLYEEMSEFDSIHNVLFHVSELGLYSIDLFINCVDFICHQVDRQVFPAHKYILLSRAPDTFTSIIAESEDKKNCYLDIEGLTAVAFEIILKIIYTNHSLTDHGEGFTGFWTGMLIINCCDLQILRDWEMSRNSSSC